MDNFQGNFMSALQGGYQFGQQIKQQRDQQNINQLAGQAYGAPEEQRPQLLGQMAGINPQAAREQEKAFEQGDERRNRSMVNMAKLLMNAPEQARPGLWRSFVPALARFGVSELPQDYNPETAPVINQAADSIVKAYGGTQAGNVVHSQKVGADGFIYNTMRDGTSVNTGVKADRQMWLRDHPGMDPTLVNKSGEVIPVGGVQGSPMPETSGMQFQIDPQGMPGEVVQAIQNREQQAGNRPWTANTPDIVGGRAPIPQDAYERVLGRGGGLARPSEAQTAAEVERARQQAQLEALPRELDLRTNAAVDQAVRTEAGKTAVEKASAAPAAIATLQTSIDSIDALLNDPDLGSIVGLGSMNPLNQIPGTKARGLIARADQIAGQSFLAAFNQLKGGGAITEREGEAATKAMARLDRSQSEADYKAALTELKGALAPAVARLRQQAAGGSQGGSAAPAQRARNPQTGQVVVLRNGQWVPE